MAQTSTPTFLEICNALRTKRAFAFEEICNDYLKARFPNLVPWISTKSESTIPGTPDAFLLDEANNLVACQYGSSPNGWQTKLLGDENEIGDAQKVAELASNNGLKIRQLIFCTTAEINLVTLNSVQTAAATKYGFPVEICDLRRISSDIEKLYPGIAFRRLGLPLHLQHFMTLDDYLRSNNERYWPKLTDVEDGKVFHPSQYITEINEVLKREKRCLLSGASGSGKSVLSIAYALWRRGTTNSETKHPEAVVFYLDVGSTFSAESGEDWYRELVNHDYQNELIIVDNCHLAPAAVNAFCYQWDRKPPELAHLLLISTPKVTQSPWEEDPEDYFENLEANKAVVEVHPENNYLGVLRTYSDLYCKAEPSRFVPLDEDLKDPERAEKLERECSHNLAGTRALLAAWYEQGGRLSDVGVEKTHEFLAKRHLTRIKRPVIGPLCSLTAFEIPIHESFIDQLPANSVEAVFKENLLVLNDTLKYGRCYRLAFHPQVAAQMFEAYVEQRYGQSYADKLLNETAFCVKNYLSSSPPNFVEVYRRLYRSGRVGLHNLLLLDAELQARAESQFSQTSLDESLWYLQALFRKEPHTATNLLINLIGGFSAEDLRSTVLALTGTQFRVVCWTLLAMNSEMAKEVLGNLPPELLSAHISSGLNPTAWISFSASSLSARLGYSRDWQKQVVKGLVIDDLVKRAHNLNAQQLMWFLDALIGTDPELAKSFIEELTPEAIGHMLQGKNIKVVAGIIKHLLKLPLKPDFFDRVGKILDKEELASQVLQIPVTTLGVNVRSLKFLGSDMTVLIEKNLNPEEIVKAFTNRGKIPVLHTLLKVFSKDFGNKVFRLIDTEALAKILGRSSLGHSGSFIEYRLRNIKPAYELFVDQYLGERFATENLREISRFITRLQRIRDRGAVRSAVETLLSVDISKQIEKGDTLPLAFLLDALAEVDSTYQSKFLEKISPETLGLALENTDISGLQTLIARAKNFPPTLLERVEMSLRQNAYAKQIPETTLNDLSHLLWNILNTFGENLSKDYCKIVDENIQDQQISVTPLEELSRFLWSIVHISGRQDLKCLNNPVLLERITREVLSDPVNTIQIFAILVLANAKTATTIDSHIFDLTKIFKDLIPSLWQYLKDTHPYLFSLTVEGLRAADPAKAELLIRTTLRKKQLRRDCLDLLGQALELAITPLSVQLLTKTRSYVEQLGDV